MEARISQKAWRNYYHIVSFSAIYIFFGLQLNSQAAEFSCAIASHGATQYSAIDRPSDFEVVLSGDIEVGDADRFRKFVKDLTFADCAYITEYPARFHPAEMGSRVLVLNSPNGGNLKEGIELARIVRDEYFSTVVEAGGACRSACAVVFMAGYIWWYEGGRDASRVLMHGGVLGFHRPFVQPEFSFDRDLFYALSEEELSDTWNTEIERAFSGATDLVREILAHDPAAWNNDLIVKMLTAVGPHEFLYPNTTTDLVDWGIRYEGYRQPDLNDRSIIQAVINACYHSRSKEQRNSLGWGYLLEDHLVYCADNNCGKFEYEILFGHDNGNENNYEEMGLTNRLLTPAINNYDYTGDTLTFHIQMEAMSGTGCTLHVTNLGSSSEREGPEIIIEMDNGEVWKWGQPALHPPLYPLTEFPIVDLGDIDSYRSKLGGDLGRDAFHDD